ncbi:MAG: hypothetical protein AB2805_15865 [Candidatus Thiodiazotropha sp.]
MRTWILFAAIAGLVWWLLSEDPIRHGPGVIAAKPPIQIAVDDMQVFDHRGYSIKPLARFEMTARVLGREDYSFDREAELAPIDLAVGWGPMSDEQVLDRIEISQGGRWYRWRSREMPLQRQEIQYNSANMHMIPKDEIIADLLDEVRLGHIVHLRGYLVEARAPDGWHWRSSLSRKDSGARACELIFVESLSFEGPS